MNTIAFSAQKRTIAGIFLLTLASAFGLVLWRRREKRNALLSKVDHVPEEDITIMEFESWAREGR